MSKEFEELVLNKLDSLDKKTTNTDRIIQEVVLKKLEIFETELKGLTTEVKNTKQEVKDINQRLGKVEIELKDTEEVVKYLNQNFIKFDYEINKKIDTLFDAHSANKDSNVIHEENIVSLNSKIFNHDIRISNLEDKVLTA